MDDESSSLKVLGFSRDAQAHHAPMNTPKTHREVGVYPKQATLRGKAGFTMKGSELKPFLTLLSKVEKLQSLTDEQVATITITIKIVTVEPVLEKQSSVINPQDVDWQF